MRLLIDGYNYLHAVGLLRPRSGKHAGPHELERARLALLGRLVLAYGPEESVTVVFDAAAAPPGVLAEGRYQHIHICNELRRTADDLIEDLIRQDSAPKGLTVVSDDRRLREAAERRGCVTLHCEEFATQIDRDTRQRQATPSAPEKPDAMTEREKADLERAFGGGIEDYTIRDE